MQTASKPKWWLLTPLTLAGLYGVQLLYDWIMPVGLKIGDLLATSFAPIDYPAAFWLAHLALSGGLLGSMAWLMGVRGWRFAAYASLVYALSILGPLWLAAIHLQQR